MSMPCPHSVWLYTAELPVAIRGLATIGPFHRPSQRHLSEANVQLFKTPRQTGGTDVHFAVDPSTHILWNSDLSIELVDDSRIKIRHCMRNLSVRIDGFTYTMHRGTFDAIYSVDARPSFVSIFAPLVVDRKPGPCKLLGGLVFDQQWLLTEPFQFFTHPSLNPALLNNAGQGMLVGAQPSLRGLAVAQNVIQCTRCRHPWSVTSKYDVNIERFIESCSAFGLLPGHLQPVVETALNITEYAVPVADETCQPEFVTLNALADINEARLFLSRWRYLSVSGPAALEDDSVCFVVGDIGFFDTSAQNALPLVSYSDVCELMIRLRKLNEWQQLPSQTLLHFRHVETLVDLFARTNHYLFFFMR